MRKKMVLVLMAFLPATSFAQDEIPSIVTIYEVAPAFDRIFTEPFETMALFTSDGKAITLTSQLATQIRGSVEDLETYLISIDQDFSSVDLIIHNHPTPARWSLLDRRFFHRLKREGFKGDYALYFPWTRSIRYLEYDENKKVDSKT